MKDRGTKAATPEFCAAVKAGQNKRRISLLIAERLSPQEAEDYRYYRQVWRYTIPQALEALGRLDILDLAAPPSGSPALKGEPHGRQS